MSYIIMDILCLVVVFRCVCACVYAWTGQKNAIPFQDSVLCSEETWNNGKQLIMCSVGCHPMQGLLGWGGVLMLRFLPHRLYCPQWSGRMQVSGTKSLPNQSERCTMCKVVIRVSGESEIDLIFLFVKTIQNILFYASLYMKLYTKMDKNNFQFN